MVVAATALDSVYAISGFGICLALAFDDGGNSEILLRLGLAAVELVAGTVMGLAFGTVRQRYPYVSLCWAPECVGTDGFSFGRWYWAFCTLYVQCWFVPHNYVNLR